MEKILNEQEKTELEKLNTNEVLMGAIKKIMLVGIYYHGTLKSDEPAKTDKNFMLGMASNHFRAGSTNEVLGQDVRATETALSMLEGGFQELEKFHKVEVSKENIKNKAR